MSFISQPRLAAMDLTAKIKSLLEANTNQARWNTWSPPSSLWMDAAEEWQDFAAKWREHTGPVHIVVNGAPVIDISGVGDLLPILPLSILVRISYLDAFEATLRRAAEEPDSGMIFTGQSGIGKTTFLLYLLVRLLQLHQVVLFSIVPHEPPLLFYHDRVYEATTPNPSSRSLPNPEGAFIWSLVDVTYNSVALSKTYAYSSPSVFPVQTSSPNPDLYKSWSKHRTLLLQLQTRRRVSRLRRELYLMLRTWSDRSRDSDFKYPRGLLRAACGDRPPDSVEVAMGVIVEAATTAFGWVPRYENVQIRRRSPEGHRRGGGPWFRCHLPPSFIKGGEPVQWSSDAVCLRPLTKAGEPVQWSVDFKSDMVAQKISSQWASAQEGRLRELMAYLSSVPKAKAIAGWLFKSLAHRRIQAIDGAQEHWPLKSMTMQHPSTFVLDVSAQSIPEVHKENRRRVTQSMPKIPKQNRRRVTFDMESINDEQLELRDDEYYIPAKSHPLIDSFLVSFEPGSSAEAPSADLWLLRMTTSPQHRAYSSKSHVEIPSIISRLVKQLRMQTPDEQPPKKKRRTQTSDKPTLKKPETVRVHYVLACPAGEEVKWWTLPPGWADEAQADAYLMEIDVLN
ncbi:hypothetical protein C8Q74DRAFT_1368072 [Fomes fomentarius]|nr:hypothetical protein C8Q74DRAFT_1368072 [Fomes fomentarius]